MGWTRRASTVALWCLVASISSLSVEALNVAVFPLPEAGHLSPLLHVLDSLDPAVDTVTLFTYSPLLSEMLQARYPWIHAYNYTTFVVDPSDIPEGLAEFVTRASLMEGLGRIDETAWYFDTVRTEDLVRTLSNWTSLSTPNYTHRPFDVAITDHSTMNSVSIACDTVGIPVVMLWPLVQQLPMTVNPRVPGLMSALNAPLGFRDTISNMLWQFIVRGSLDLQQRRSNSLRAAYGLPPVTRASYFDDRIWLTRGVPGFDVAQPLCPNMIPLGTMRPVLWDVERDPLTPALHEFRRGCSSGRLVYISFGSIARLPEEWLREIELGLERLLVQAPHLCVLWKLAPEQQPAVQQFGRSDPARQRLVASVPSQRGLMEQGFVDAFVTHCGATTVYEVIDASSVPLVGIPLFADQFDVCRRVVDAGIGVSLRKDHLNAGDLAAAILDVVQRRDEIMAKEAQLALGARFLNDPVKVRGVLRLAASPGGPASLRCVEGHTAEYALRSSLAPVAIGAALAAVVAANGALRRRKGGLQLLRTAAPSLLLH